MTPCERTIPGRQTARPQGGSKRGHITELLALMDLGLEGPGTRGRDRMDDPGPGTPGPDQAPRPCRQCSEQPRSPAFRGRGLSSRSTWPTDLFIHAGAGNRSWPYARTSKGSPTTHSLDGWQPFPTRGRSFICRTTWRLVSAPTTSLITRSMKGIPLSYLQQQTVTAGSAVPLWYPYYGAPIGEAARPNSSRNSLIQPTPSRNRPPRIPVPPR